MDNRRRLDCLYGEIELDPAIMQLADTPLVQRLRDVRLSNIDSLDLPGVASITRFEHSLGVAVVASRIGIARTLSAPDFLVVQAAALLHDGAVAPFGHLMEEAFRYHNISFDHETKWAQISGKMSNEVGGLDYQVYLGRGPGLENWANRVFRSDAPSRLNSIFEAIHGKGPFGPLISGDLDVDNLDNVIRIAYHMGLQANPRLPLEFSSRIIGVEGGTLVVSDDAVGLADAWIDARSRVYSKLMLSPRDFIGKAMLLSAMVRAIEEGEVSSNDWSLTDRALIQKLLTSSLPDVEETITRWLLSRLWSCTRLVWMEGPAPSLPSLLDFSRSLSAQYRRRVFIYRIMDKRNRQVRLRTTTGSTLVLGTESNRWLLGFVSDKNDSLPDHELVHRTTERYSCTFEGFADPAVEPSSKLFFRNP